MVLGAGLPRTILRKRMPRAGDHTPPRRRKTLHRGVADASARSGEQECTSGLVRCRHLRCSWIKPRLDPRRGGSGACEGDAIMQSEWPLLPEFNLLGSDAIADPVRRPRHGTDGELRGEARNGFLERQPAFQRGGLFAGPGADLRHPRARGKVGVRLRWRDRFDLTAYAHLTLQRFPVKG